MPYFLVGTLSFVYKLGAFIAHLIILSVIVLIQEISWKMRGLTPIINYSVVTAVNTSWPTIQCCCQTLQQ